MTIDPSTGAGLPERAQDAGAGKPAAPRRQRMSAQRKQEAVLRILRGEDLELVSREPDVTAAALSGWRDDFLAAGAASLRSRLEDGGSAPAGGVGARAFGEAWADQGATAGSLTVSYQRPYPLTVLA